MSIKIRSKASSEIKVCKQDRTNSPDDDHASVLHDFARGADLRIPSIMDNRTNFKQDIETREYISDRANGSNNELDIIRLIVTRGNNPAAVQERDPGTRREKRNLQRAAEEKIRQTKEKDFEWELLSEEVVQVSETEWKVIQQKKNLPQQLYRTEIVAVKRNNTGHHEILPREVMYEVDLATAELCEEKLQGFRLNHYIRFMDTARSLTEEYHQEFDRLTDTSTQEERNNLQNRYHEKIKEARKKYDKDIEALDALYKNQKLDSQTLADLEQMEAKEANENDLKRRIKSVEAKIARLPEERHNNAQSIREKLDEIDTLMQKTGLSRATDQQPTSTQIISSLRDSLAKDKISPDVFSSISELHRRFQRHSENNQTSQDDMIKLHTTLEDTHVLFKKREINLDEWQALPLKIERYTRSQDAETMFHNNQLLANRAAIEAARGELAEAQAKEAFYTSEAERIHKALQIGGASRPLTAVRENLDPLRKDREQHNLRQINSSTFLRTAVISTSNAHPPLTNSQQLTEAQQRNSYQRSPIPDTDALPPLHPKQNPSSLYSDAQRELEQAHFNLLFLTQKLAVLEEREKTLQKQIELNKSRYDKNEEREKIKRDNIIELDKLAIQNKRKVYESLVSNQRKLDALEINVLLLEVHARNLFMSAALAVFIPDLPNTIQREASSQWRSFEGILRS